MAIFVKAKNLSPWRRLSLACWGSPNDPTVYGGFEFDATFVLNLLDKLNETSTVKITLTHLFAKILGLLIASHPQVNGVIKWGTIYYRQSVDLFVQVAIPQNRFSGDQLSGVKICQINHKSLADIATELSGRAQAVRSDKDPQFQKHFNMTRYVPQFALKTLLWLNSFLVHNLGLNLPALGLNADPFGSAMFTSVGSLDVPPGFAPLVPPSYCPIIFCLGRIEKKPWVVGDHIEARPVAGFTITFDHRFMDGLTGAKMFNTLMEYLYHPEKAL